MTWRAVTDKQLKLIELRLPKRKPNPKGGRPPVDDRRCFEGILWSSGPVPRGANCLSDMARRVPSIDGFVNGLSRACSSTYGGPFSTS